MARASDPAAARSAATRVLTALRSRGHVALFAGGCVRDELLNIPATDYDVATDATPDAVRSLFRRTRHVGAAFGVVLVHEDDAVVEVATFRADGAYSDSRRPDSVTFADPRTDAHRRDFTINALFLDPLASSPDSLSLAATSHPSAPRTTAPALLAGARLLTSLSPLGGVVIDFVAGVDDLRTRTLRAVGDPAARLREDHLRALRAVRFAARLDLRIEPATQHAIRAHASHLRGVSRERIGDEIRRMLVHPSRARAVELIESLTLDAPALAMPLRPVPSDARPPGSILSRVSFDPQSSLFPPQPGRTPADAPTHAPRSLPELDAICLALAAWMLERSAPPDPAPRLENATAAALASTLREALCLSNDESALLLAILKGFSLLSRDWRAASVAAQKRLASSHWFESAVRLLDVCLPDLARDLRARVADLLLTPGGIHQDPWVTGDDLVRLGFPPGPLFKSVLDAVFDAQLERRVSTPHHALALASELARKGGV